MGTNGVPPAPERRRWTDDLIDGLAREVHQCTRAINAMRDEKVQHLERRAEAAEKRLEEIFQRRRNWALAIVAAFIPAIATILAIFH